MEVELLAVYVQYAVGCMFIGGIQLTFIEHLTEVEGRYSESKQIACVLFP